MDRVEHVVVVAAVVGRALAHGQDGLSHFREALSPAGLNAVQPQIHAVEDRSTASRNSARVAALSSCLLLRVANGVFSSFRHVNVSRVGTVVQRVAKEINGSSTRTEF